MLALLLTLVACTGEPPADTAATEDTDEATADPCEGPLEIRVDGNDPPAVGDTWTMWLWCDDALMLGATRIIWDPTDIATVSDNTSEFLYAGSASLMVQVGSRRQTREVTVSE